MSENAQKKILVADDSLTIQKVIRLALSGDGYEIQTVSDGKEALEQASLFRPDICIIDVSLPAFDAYQVREQLLAKPDLKDIPIILMSSAFEKVDETRAQALGFAGHLIKPFDPSHLRSTLLSVANLAPKKDPVIETINAPYVEEMARAAQTPPKAEPAPIQFEPPGFKMKNTTEKTSTHHLNPMDDIQQMAKNTFEMSGLNQHDWGMIELGKEQPAPQATHSHQFNDYQEPNFNESATQLMNEVGQIDFQQPFSTPTPAAGPELEALIKSEVEKALQSMQGQLRDRIEHELRAEVHAQIPLMAEKIIKEEIHKLLSDPPV